MGFKENTQGFGKMLLRKILGLLLATAVVGGAHYVSEQIGNRPKDTEQNDTPVIQDTAEDTIYIEPTDPRYTFDLGFSISLPDGFTQQESQYNDFFGIGATGDYAIICNAETIEEGDTIADFAQRLANSNNAGLAQQEVDGSYYITYINETDSYQYYTAIRQGQSQFYRVAFYCAQEDFSHYRPLFVQWASTIEVE